MSNIHKLLSSIYTKKDCDELLDICTKLVEATYKVGKFNPIINAGKGWELVLADILNNSTEKTSVRTLLTQVIDALHTMNYIKVKLPFRSSNEFSKVLYTHLTRKNHNYPLCIDIEYDPRIEAGALLSADGMYYDLSVRKIVRSQLEHAK